MGNRHWAEEVPEYVSMTERWPGPGVGRYWKRKLSKARRKHAKEQLNGRRGKEPTAIESEVNWRTW